MMVDLYFSRDVKAVRKGHWCEQCGRPIEVAQPAKYHSGKYDDIFWGNYTHVECDAAANAYAKLNDTWGEEYPFFQHMENSEFEHHAWLLENHPVVAHRLLIEPEEKRTPSASGGEHE